MVVHKSFQSVYVSVCIIGGKRLGKNVPAATKKNCWTRRLLCCLCRIKEVPVGLPVCPLNANYIVRWRNEFSKQLQDLYTAVALLSKTHLKPHERFFDQNYHFSRTDRSQGRMGIRHNHVDLCYMCDTYSWQRQSLFIRDKPTLSPKKMIHKDYESKSSGAK
jgi:hypothetical protein